MSDELLSIYLNDHLAGLTAGVELAERCRGNNPEEPLQSLLAEARDGFQHERSLLRDLLQRLEAREDSLKQGAAWVSEKLGRLKSNGSLVGYSELSRVLELEALVAVAEGSNLLWESLAQRHAHDSRLATLDLTALQTSTGQRLERLRAQHRSAVARAFADR